MEENALVIEAFLDKTDHLVEVVEDGDLAVEKITSGNRYNLILMDIQMPRMDGLEATRQIRHWEKNQKCEPTPILALTAHAMSGDKDKSLAAGCNGHITKPVAKKKLIEMINQYAC
jgi:CheY-like chemotaxis protein